MYIHIIKSLDGIYPDGLQEVTVEVLANTKCSELYGPIITENMMCTSGQNSRGSCFGDSGGPAIVKNDEGFYVQVLFIWHDTRLRSNTINLHKLI